MQTILGANGIIATELAKALTTYTRDIRLVSRDPKKVNETDQLFKADLLDPLQAMKAVEGSSIVYLMVGLKYHIKVWETSWPVIMTNVINACKAHKAKLVFFDNVYCYGTVNGEMTEATPIKPTSKKGVVRAKLVEQLEAEIKRGDIEVLIARAADFLGATPLSFVSMLVFENMAKKKTPQWLVNADAKHSYTYVVDAGKATALLANSSDTFNQTWHLPADQKALTGKELINIAAGVFGVKPSFMTLSPIMIKIFGWFVPEVKESVEMLYQYDRDYIFNSDKFNKRFDMRATPIEEAVKAAAELFKNKA